MADDCIRFLLFTYQWYYGQIGSADRNADDSENMCLCMDGADRIFCYEKGM